MLELATMLALFREGYPVLGHAVCHDYHQISVINNDTRRMIDLTIPNPTGLPWEAEEYESPRGLKVVLEAVIALKAIMESGDAPAGTVGVELDEANKLVSFCTDPKKDTSRCTQYLPLKDYQLSSFATQTILRSELTEVRRSLGGTSADVVSYPESLLPAPGQKETDNRYVFKYSLADTVDLWPEIQFLARLPPHPNMVLLDRLVLDEATGKRVVGLTMKYVAAQSLNNARSLLKLKWLRELMQAVDDLNLKHGVLHQDIADRNLLIDPDTDSLLLIDFGHACRIGTLRDATGERYWLGRDDVKGVLLFLYEFITRDPTIKDYILHEVDDKDFTDLAKWTKHPDVELDHDVEDFYNELMAWVRTRRAGKELAHHSEAPEPLHWPDIPKKAWSMGGMVADWTQKRRAFVHWERPASVDLDPKRRLLATGKYADEEPGARKAAGAGASKTAPPQNTAASQKGGSKDKEAVGGGQRPRRAAASQKTAGKGKEVVGKQVAEKKVAEKKAVEKKAVEKKAVEKKVVEKEAVGPERRTRRAGASQKGVGKDKEKEVASPAPQPSQATATKKRKKDGSDGGAPDSGVAASPPTKRRSSRRVGTGLSVAA